MSSDSDRSEGVDDFVKQLRFSVHEEAPLWEVPLGATERGERTVTHGPRIVGVLVRTRSLVGTRADGSLPPRPNELPLDLENDEARRILSDPDRWTLDELGTVCLVETAKGTALKNDAWYSALSE